MTVAVCVPTLRIRNLPSLLPKWHLNLCRHLRQVWQAQQCERCIRMSLLPTLEHEFLLQSSSSALYFKLNMQISLAPTSFAATACFLAGCLLQTGNINYCKQMKYLWMNLLQLSSAASAHSPLAQLHDCRLNISPRNFKLHSVVQLKQNNKMGS